jgi:hypothetical protein
MGEARLCNEKVEREKRENGKLFGTENDVRTKRNFAHSSVKSCAKMAAFIFLVSFRVGSGAIKIVETILSCL